MLPLEKRLQIWEELSGLYYLRARYYNPRTGRFTQEDVIYNDGLNLYAYCNSNPVIYSDPSGFARKNINSCEPKTGNSRTKVNNMGEFFEDDFGKSIKGNVAKTKKQFQGQNIYEVTKKTNNPYLKKGDKFYLDNLHKDHIEVFDKRGNLRAVLNLDGTLNEVKTKSAIGRKLN